MSTNRDIINSEYELRNIDNVDKILFNLCEHLKLKIIRVTDEYGQIISYEFQSMEAK